MGMYPKNRAPRVDRSKMTPEEWAEHKRKKDSEKCARWNARHPGISRAALRKRRAENQWYQALYGAGWRARKAGLDYDLTPEWAAATFTGFCSLTGLPFILVAYGKAGQSGGKPCSPSIDRINPLKGYTQANCRWVLHAVNSFKGTMGDTQMYHIAEALLAKRTLPLS